MIVYTICRKTGRTLKVEKYPDQRDVTVKQAAALIAQIMTGIAGRERRVRDARIGASREGRDGHGGKT
jgi:hypothetical protein